MPSRPRLLASSRVTSRSPNVIVPPVGLRSPESRLTKVVLPAPFGPITAWISPVTSSSDTSFTAASPPKRFDSAVVRSATSVIVVLRRDARDQRLDAARDGEHNRDDDQAFGELPVLGEALQVFFQPHHHDGADQRPGDAALSAEHDHHQRDRRLVPAEHLRRDEAELRRREVAGDAGERAGDDERREAYAVDGEAERASAPL